MNRERAEVLGSVIAACESTLNGAGRCSRDEWAQVSQTFDAAWAELVEGGWTFAGGEVTRRSGWVVSYRVVL